MGSSAKKKKEKKKDFQKPKLKVGKARPKNTNATDTSFSAKSIVFKQQSLSENGVRDSTALFNHNLSLLSSKADTQRRDALVYLTTACGIRHNGTLPQPVSAIVEKAQPLVLDGSSQVRQQLLKLLDALPKDDLGNVETLLMYIRAGMTHLSTDIKSSSLDAMDWLLTAQPEGVVSCAGGWIKILRTFQNLLSWTDAVPDGAHKGWSASKTSANLGSNKLLVHQLRTLSRFLTIGLKRPDVQAERVAAAQRAAQLFPFWHTDAHLMPKKSNAFGYLNLFGTPRDVESEMYEDAEDRCEVFGELGLYDLFCAGVKEAKKEAGEVGRAAALAEKALKLADVD